MSTLKIICNITYKINAASSLHSTVINSLNDVLQAKRTIVKRKTPFVTEYSKALRKCYSDFFFFFGNRWWFLLERGGGSFLMYQYHEPKLVLQSNIKDCGQPFFFFQVFLFFLFYFIFKLYIIVLVLPNIKMNPPQVYMWTTILMTKFHIKIRIR